jgi:mannose-1-phosphate guanylyltransferase
VTIGRNCKTVVRGSGERAAFILAGGDGTRLRGLTIKITASEAPKQFCRVIGGETLYEQTLRRVSLSIQPELTFTTVTRTHRPFYRELLRDSADNLIIEQPANRGTLAAILCSLFRLTAVSPEAAVVLMPSDHYVSDDVEFMRHVDLAFDWVAEWPEFTVLLGITPSAATNGYGWVEATPFVAADRAPFLRVLRFWEKPKPYIARKLLTRGCLWNSFVVVASASTLLGLMAFAAPEFYVAFNSVRDTFGTEAEDEALAKLYSRIVPTDFSRHVLGRFPTSLAVLPVDGFEWNDLGEPYRVLETLSRIGSSRVAEAASLVPPRGNGLVDKHRRAAACATDVFPPTAALELPKSPEPQVALSAAVASPTAR